MAAGFKFLMFMVLHGPMAMAIDTAWYDARATFYDDMKGGKTMRDCGYGDLIKQGYGLRTAALSTALFNDGAACGACFEIMCVADPQWCIPNAGSIQITGTNFCAPSNSQPNGNWCNPPQKHFELTTAMFVKLAPYKAGIIPVRYRRIPCSKQGGVKFEIKGTRHWTQALVYNVGGAGDVADVKIKGAKSDWKQLSRFWGQVWLNGNGFLGDSLSFQVTTSDGKMLQFNDIAPVDWGFGQTFNGKINF